MNDSPVDCQNREWTEPQRDPRRPEKRADNIRPYNPAPTLNGSL